jgi:hypothetical protein
MLSHFNAGNTKDEQNNLMTVKKSSKKKIVKPSKQLVAAIPPPPGRDASCEELDEYFSKYSWAQIEKAGYSRSLNKAETAWVNKVSAEAKKRVESRNRSQLNLALPADQLARFTQYAKKKHIPPSTLARSWILERLDQVSKDA